ncbi:MAG: phenylalanine--tRNA ligase subunit alpha, partial [Formosimonas sp.]
MTDLSHIITEARAAFASATRPADLENEKAKFLGKDGILTRELKTLGALPIEEKKTRGAQVNAVRQQVEALLTEARNALAEAALNEKLATEQLDVTLPGRGSSMGGIHPVTRVTRRVSAIFRSMGFDVADGPEIENDWFNFTSLNSPENHPARSMQDTFYVQDQDERGHPLVLRTHTSPMQVR